MPKQITLGSKCRDRISGFTGIVIAITEWLNGCRRVSLQPQELKDGKRVEADTFDIEQLECIKEHAVNLPSHDTGGPTIHPVQRPNVG